MAEILALLQSIASIVSATVLQQLSHVIYGMLISHGRNTILELSRWTEKGDSYRTIQQLYHTPLLWLQIQWIFFISQLQKQMLNILRQAMKWSLAKLAKRQYPIQAIQMVKRGTEPVEGKSSVGRPKGSKNKKSKKPTLKVLSNPFYKHFGSFWKWCFGCAVSGHESSLWKLSKRMDSVANRTAIRFKTSF